MSTWLYQYWYFAFKTAKFWTNGPRNWTAENLGLSRHPDLKSTVFMGGVTKSPFRGLENAPNGPKKLCYWSVHVGDKHLNSYKSDKSEWPEHWKKPAFEERLKNALKTNNFSNIKADNLPLAHPQLVKAINRSTSKVLEMSLGFSIMAGNYNLIEELLQKVEAAEVDLSGLYPYHLATSYLDGSVECCHVFGLLCRKLRSGTFSLSRCYTNAYGHTVLDNLMIAILKGHSAASPGVVDTAWRNQTRYAGEEIDICGRWDPDSDDLSTVIRSGVGAIPFGWKHKFCHTSAQVILHCIQAADFHGADLNVPSGLFLKICEPCGLRLQLLPLHTLVFTAFQLAQSRCGGEDLFGIIACLLCLLHLGVNPSLKASISTSALLDAEQAESCCHAEMTPLDLAEALSFQFSETWTRRIQVGWKILCHILLQGAKERTRWEFRKASSVTPSSFASEYAANTDELDDTMSPGNGYKIGCDDCLWGEGFFGDNKFLGHIWAAVQTELLTHRRLREGDIWVSEFFDMDTLLENLELDEEVSIGLLKGGVMKDYCSCGSFTEVPWPKVKPGKHVTASILRSSKYYDARVEVEADLLPIQ